MTDRRELILERLLVIADAIPGVVYAARNDINPTDSSKKLPAIIILEADEDVLPADAEGRGRPSKAPVIVTMVPQLLLVVKDDSPDIGATLNGMRANLIKTILNDATLLSIATNNGIRYRGLVSGLAFGRQMMGVMALNFAFTYVLYPAEL